MMNCTMERKLLESALLSVYSAQTLDRQRDHILTINRAPASTDSSIRYAAYATRIRTALLSAQRYVAYTSDIGESFRPVAHPNLVRTAYGISWAYLIGDVSHEGYKAYCQNQRILHPNLPREAAQERYNDAKSDLKTVADDAGVSLVPRKVTPLEDYRTVMVQRALFQGLASMVSFRGERASLCLGHLI
jgi:fission process protein 1